MMYININPDKFGLEGFLESSLKYVRQCNKYIRDNYMDIKDVNEFCNVLDVRNKTINDLKLIFGDVWYDESSFY